MFLFPSHRLSSALQITRFAYKNATNKTYGIPLLIVVAIASAPRAIKAA